MQNPICTVEGCGRRKQARGLCNTHYSRWRLTGTADDPVRLSQLERLLALVEKTDACWLWRGATTSGGYGTFERTTAHRVSYELHVGPIPDGLHLDHLCRVRNCVNPAHLEPVTSRENTYRSPVCKKWKTHCIRGHEFTPENTRIAKNGTRHCRECFRMHEQRRQRRR